LAGHSSGLEEGDILLELDHELVTHPASLFKSNMPSSLDAVLLRNRQVLRCSITTFPTEMTQMSRFLFFCGGIIQEPYLSVRQRVSILHSEVFLAGNVPGSPFQRYNVESYVFITHVNNLPTPTLDSFIEEIKKIEDNKYFRLTGMTTHNAQFVKTLKRDEHYFPLIKYEKDPKEPHGWKAAKV
jgi:pro-apoptotic serine protease NMA111